MTNIILNTDSYKASHYLQYPEHTTNVFSYIESRGGVFPETLFFGLQVFIQEYLLNPITIDDIREAKELFTLHGLPFNQTGWMHILSKHDGYLPLTIRAVPEGTMVPTGNVLVTVENIDPEVPWLTSYIETALLRAVWYPTTVATISKNIKTLISSYLDKTADDSSSLPFKLHDFGSRGVSSEESAMLGGMAHLVNFMGTDTMSAIVGARKHYYCSMAGYSIPASEHSTITSWGRDGEIDAYRNMLSQFGGKDKLVACVSDSYDITHAVKQLWGEQLRGEVTNAGGTLVVRPDSGVPVDMVMLCVSELANNFGYTINDKGYKVLPSSVRVIQGDGVNADEIHKILQTLKNNHFSAENVAFGMGGELLQKMNRDTQKFAMKASAVKIDGEWRDVYKDPVTDPGKTSKKGRIGLMRNESTGEFETHRIDENLSSTYTDAMKTVYVDGEIVKEYSLTKIRDRSNR